MKIMRTDTVRRVSGAAALVVGGLLAASAQGAPFSSGSSGADGAFNPSSNTTVTLPANGILNYTTVTIPAGVTVRYVRDPALPNVPAIILATGDVTIAGTIDVSGESALQVINNITDRSQGGAGGPGGYAGGRGGGVQVNRLGGTGLGPGGARGGLEIAGLVRNGAGASYGTQGGAGNSGVPAGSVYGTSLLTPLLGGSGGGGGSGAEAANGKTGAGGGGGGGAILIAASGALTVSGSVLARGGNGGTVVDGASGPGGGGSGGAIRLAAPSVTVTGTLDVNGGSGVTFNPGGLGRTRVDVVPTGTLNLAGVPVLSITSVAGIAAPGTITGVGDITLGGAEPNPATVSISASGVPVGNTVTLRLVPQRAEAITATSAPLAGTLASSTATASINVPQGISTLTATASYTITVAMGEMLRQYAEGERVEKVELVASYGGPSTARLITASGRAFEVPAEVLRTVSVGG